MAYNATDPTGGASGNQDPFNYARNQATQRAAGAQAQNTDALQRRFASMGNSNSGAAIQAQSNADRGVQQDLENTQGNIGMEEAKSAIPFQLQEQQQAFQGQQAGLARGEQQAARAQQESQFSRSQSQEESQFGRKLGEQQSEFGQEMPLKSKALDLESQKMGMDEEAMQFNEGLARYQQDHSGGLLGAGGFLGLGSKSGGGGGGFLGFG